MQLLVAAAVVDGPLVVVTHQCFSRGTCVITKQAKLSSPSLPVPSASSNTSFLPLTTHDYISVTISTTSPPNQETIVHLPAPLSAQQLVENNHN
jgi:hypothetical protein